MLFAEAV